MIIERRVTGAGKTRSSVCARPRVLIPKCIRNPGERSMVLIKRVSLPPPAFRRLCRALAGSSLVLSLLLSFFLFFSLFLPHAWFRAFIFKIKNNAPCFAVRWRKKGRKAGRRRKMFATSRYSYTGLICGDFASGLRPRISTHRRISYTSLYGTQNCPVRDSFLSNPPSLPPPCEFCSHRIIEIFFLRLWKN